MTNTRKAAAMSMLTLEKQAQLIALSQRFTRNLAALVKEDA